MSLQRSLPVVAVLGVVIWSCTFWASTYASAGLGMGFGGYTWSEYGWPSPWLQPQAAAVLEAFKR